MRFSILSLFPDYFASPFAQSIIGQAQKKGLIEIDLVDIRAFSEDRHRRVDDRPYGGGPGMVMQAEPVYQAICQTKRAASRVIYLNPQGRPLDAQKCRKLAQEDDLLLLCGHYEGIDARAIQECVDEEISIGDFVLTNGCIAAIVLVDAVARFIPGVLGDEASPEHESFEQGLLDHDVYTRPEEWRGKRVPEVLLSGHHEKIADYRLEERRKKTQSLRPDLLSSGRDYTNY